MKHCECGQWFEEKCCSNEVATVRVAVIHAHQRDVAKKLGLDNADEAERFGSVLAVTRDCARYMTKGEESCWVFVLPGEVEGEP
jgi:hypothetical protein